MSDEMISLGAKLAQLAQLKPDAPAVTCGETTLTYEQFHRLSNRAARGLAAKGVKFGDLVTLGLPNSTDFAASWGAVSGAVSYRLDASTNASFSSGGAT